jgi:putative transposase
MRWMHKVRLYPKPSQVARLEFMLHQTRHLYNAALEQRKDGWRRHRRSISVKDQLSQLTAARSEMPQLAGVYQECEAATIRRLDIALDGFFKRVKRGETAGYPRFKSAARWRQLEFPHGDRALKVNADQSKVRIPGVGSVRLRKGRAVPAFGRAFVVEKCRHWYAVFECEREVSPLVSTGEVVGIDRGVVALVAYSDTGPQAAPRIGEGLAPRLRAAQRRVSRRKKGGSRRRAAVGILARVHEKIGNVRRDYAHKLSRQIVNGYDGIALEDLTVRNMVRSAKGTVTEPGRNVAAKSGLNRSILDAAWSTLKTLIVEKAAWAARRVVEVEARYSSQECSQCGYVAAENRRSQAEFVCVQCGFALNADWNAARVIEKRAQFGPAGSFIGSPIGVDLRSPLSPGSTGFTQHGAA